MSDRLAGTVSRVRNSDGKGNGTRGPSPRGYTHYKPNAEDRDQVRKLVLLGSSREKIAASLGISVYQLTNAYRDTLEFYQARMLSQVANQRGPLTKTGAEASQLIQEPE